MVKEIRATESSVKRGEAIAVVRATDSNVNEAVDSELFRSSIALLRESCTFTTDNLGGILNWNPGVELCTGFKAEDVMGNNLSMFYMDGEQASLALHFAEKETIYLEEGLKRRKDGTHFRAETTLTALFDEQQNVTGFTVTIKDLAENNRAQAVQHFLNQASGLLAESLDYETGLRKLARLSVNSICDLTLIAMRREDGTLGYLSAAHSLPEYQAFLEALQSTDIILPESILSTTTPRLLSSVEDSLLISLAASHDQIIFLKELKLVSGLLVPVVVRKRAIGFFAFFSSERSSGFSETELKSVEELARRTGILIENAKLFQEAQEASRIKDEFLATVSHELRTPMTSILGWSRLLLSADLDEKNRKRAIETIDRNARSQSQIIDDLLDISRIITGKLQLEVKPINLARIIEQAVDSLRPAADVKNIHLSIYLDSTIGPVSGDPNRIQQIIWNLLSNAIKFTPDGGRVQIRLENQNSRAQIVIKDTGIGISKEFLPYVFDRFRQADGSMTRKFGGLGLGLAIVRYIVELHAGTVSAFSNGENQGSVFIVSLPIIQSVSNRKTDSAEEEEMVDYHPVIGGLKILVIDDEPDALDLVVTLLSQCGADTRGTCSAAEGVTLFDEWRPDLIVSDLGMPGEDGYEFIKRIRSRSSEEGGQTPAAALTAYARTEDRLRSLSAGFQAHITKPVEPSELIDILSTLANNLKTENF
jgi:PAS domain S-box-containing protein